MRVKVYTIDGGLSEYRVGDSILEDLKILRSRGLEGKSLVHALVGADWGAPPSGVRIVGKASDGTTIDEYIPSN